jgi:hypothetical protein
MLWNEIIAEEEAGKREKTDMTLKSAYHLQEHYKQLKRDSNASLTMVGVADANKALRRELRGKERAESTAIPEALSAKDAVDKGFETDDNDAPMPLDDDESPPVDNETSLVTVIDRANGNDTDGGNGNNSNSESTSGIQAQRQPGPVLGRQGTQRVMIPLALGQSSAYTAAQPHLQRSQPKQKRASPRCRQCGNVRNDPRWKEYHLEAPGFTVGSGKKRTYPCTVPESDRQDGFPLSEGARMPSLVRKK